MYNLVCVFNSSNTSSRMSWVRPPPGLRDISRGIFWGDFFLFLFRMFDSEAAI